ncbi:MAG: hypothetical protein PHY47_00580 [Lachnospiraceae bacterium]|nr:hypothetical protein [Lachnospiraceae bacterium]
MFLTLKQTKKVRKGEKLSKEHYSLYYGKSLYSGKEVVSREFLNSLVEACRRGEKHIGESEKKLEEIAEKAEETENLEPVVHECVDTTIISSFTIVQTEHGITLDSDGFLIKDSYLPKDDKAPDRVYDIAMEFKAVLDEYLTFKSSQTPKLSNPTHTAIQDMDDDWFLAKYVGNEAVIEERTKLPVKTVFDTLYHYLITLPQEAEEAKHAPFTSTTGKKHLKGAILRLTEENNICIVNIDNYNDEVKTVVTELSKSFNIA